MEKVQGSGKTLAFGLPIVNSLVLEQRSGKLAPGLRALILTPTRELALQVKAHIAAVLGEGLGVAAVVGGLSAQKQERLLKRCPQIVVGTPGRLWAFIQAGAEKSYMAQLSSLRFLVIDETDRMVEKGHFEELEHILGYVNEHSNAEARQTFVFSATLTYVHPPPKRLDHKHKHKLTPQEKIGEIIKLTGMRKARKQIDITRSFGTAEALTEARINCQNLLQKDAALYYILIKYPGRTLVFTNSIDSSRRLYSLLKKLQLTPLLLHARMAQKQRLKSLEKFAGGVVLKESDKAVLLATDVAARGLDIKGIQHVLHYHVPKTAEVYVHRSGRTARALQEGLSLLLIDPNDANFYRRIVRNLTRSQDLPIFPIDEVLLNEVEERVKLATEIESAEHRLARAKGRETWLRQTAESMDIIIDEDQVKDVVVRGDGERDQLRATARRLEGRLKAMLREPLKTARFLSATRYPTFADLNQKPTLPEMADPIASVKASKNAVESKVGGRLSGSVGKKGKKKGKPRKRKRQ